MRVARLAPPVEPDKKLLLVHIDRLDDGMKADVSEQKKE